MNEAGKGDKQRPTDHNAFSSNWDLIWGKKNKDKEDGTETNRSDSPVQDNQTQDTGTTT